MATASAGPRYAPEDPTLPKPWRGLVDGSTGYLYYWNPETNVTQYERPVAPAPPLPSGPPPQGAPKIASIPVSLVQQQSGPPNQQMGGGSSDYGPQSVGGAPSGHGQQMMVGQGVMGSNGNDRRAGDDGRRNGGMDPGMMMGHQPKLAAIPMARNQQHQVMRHGGVHQQNGPSVPSNGSSSAMGHVAHNMYAHGPSSQAYSNNQPMRSSTRDTSSLTHEGYRRQHEITVMGDNVPAPFMTFESTGFPSEILKEVRY